MNPSLLANTKIVMVGTTHSGNIGAAARAMKNMGIGQLVLVSPQASIDEEAIQRSSRADEILHNATIVSTLEEAVQDAGLVVGTSARSRHIPWPLMSPRQCATKAKEVARHGEVAIVFGRESSGLTNEELQLCHAHVHIPTDESFSSLNVSQAVQVICYELRLAALEDDQKAEQAAEQQIGQHNDQGEERQGESQSEQNNAVSWGVDWDYPMATHGEVNGMLQHFEETLIRIGFLDPNTPKQLMPRVRRLFQRAMPDKLEINILRGMLASVNKLAAKTDAIKAPSSDSKDL